MKKTKLMRAALLLLVLTLITSCFVGGTFAKYTTSASSNDSARVAKWGFTANEKSIVLTDLFKTAYDKNVLGQADVIAPGTTNSASFKFEYNTTNNGATAPEVAYTFKVSTEGSEIAKEIEDNTNIQWKLDDGKWGTWADLLAAIEALDGNKTDDKYEAGTLPTAFEDGNNTHTVAWQWLFETESTTDNAAAATAQDETDTKMGNADPLATVKLVISVTATQID